MTEDQENGRLADDVRGEGQVKQSPDKHVQVVEQDLTDLMNRGDVANTVSGLAELDPKYMGGTAGSVVLVNWLNQLCGQARDLQSENRSLQKQIITTSVRNAELKGELLETKSNKNLRGILNTGGSLLIGASIASFSLSPVLAGITGLVGILLLAGAWDITSKFRGKSS